MIKYFCDKCGKELKQFDNELSFELFKVTVDPPEIRKWSDSAETGTYILCYECVRKFNKWLYESDSKYIAMEQNACYARGKERVDEPSQQKL